MVPIGQPFLAEQQVLEAMEIWDSRFHHGRQPQWLMRFAFDRDELSSSILRYDYNGGTSSFIVLFLPPRTLCSSWWRLLVAPLIVFQTANDWISQQRPMHGITTWFAPWGRCCILPLVLLMIRELMCFS